MKLSRELSKRDTGRTLYILDEPTTGLHFHDTEQLLRVLHRLRDHGNTVVVIEHNLEVVKDRRLDCGPRARGRRPRRGRSWWRARRRRYRRARALIPGTICPRCCAPPSSARAGTRCEHAHAAHRPRPKSAREMTKMSALICGSLAYDTIMVFNDRFRNHILPDKIHVLSVSFLVPQLRREFGGCAGKHRLQPQAPRRRPVAHGDRRQGLRPVLPVDGRV